MSAVTVREVLTLPALQGSEVVAGMAGMDRNVSGINVMEVPDIEAFVEAGEILLTTAYPLHEHPEQLSSLVRTLAHHGLAALAIKTGRYLEDLPREMLEAADELAFPLIVLHGVSGFNEVIGAVLAVVLSDYGADPAGAEAIRERLTGVALSGGGLDEIARTLAGALERQVDIVDERGGSLLQARAGADDAMQSRTWVFPVSVAGIERARLTVHGEDEPTLGQRRLIRQACFAAGMHIAQAFASVELDRRMRVLHLEELVSARGPDVAALIQRTRLFGWEFSGPRAVHIARVQTDVPDGLAVAAALEAFGDDAVTWSRGSEIVAIARDGGSPHAWQRALADAAGDAVVATGTTGDGIEHLGASHAAAREALTIAGATGQVVAVYDQLTVERAILAIPRERLVDLVEHELAPLLTVDRASSGTLCDTLEAFLAIGNAAEAARRLFIHYNTMKHRMARITELLGSRLDGPQARLSLAFALRARRFLEPVPTPAIR